MKLKILLMFSFLSLALYANEFNIYAGIDGWRHDTGIEESGDPGYSLGSEYLFSIIEDTFYLGIGGEYKSEIKGIDKNNGYSPIIGYIKGKLFLYSSDFYILGKAGYSWNSDKEDPIDDGAYISAGVGYDFSKMYLELAYELLDTNDNNDLFNNGNLQIVGIKLGYKF